MRALNELLDEHEQLKAQFIYSELSLGITFCQIALTTNNSASAERNAQNARRAYQSATHALERAQLNAKKQQEVEAELIRLEDLLRQIGEVEGRGRQGLHHAE